MLSIGIITVSDSRSKGERIDVSGDYLQQLIEEEGYKCTSRAIVPDEIPQIQEEVKNMVRETGVDVIFTSGGTGISPRDVTPDALESLYEKVLPGIGERMRQYSYSFTPRALLSRGGGGIFKNTLIISMPGSKKAVKECFDAIKDILEHAVETIKGQTVECGRR